MCIGHLIWIIPLSAAFGFLLAALMAANRRNLHDPF